MTEVPLPPDELLARPDALLGADGPGPYAHSPLRQVVGTRANEHARVWYEAPAVMRHPLCQVKSCAHPELAGWLSDIGSFDPRARLHQPAADDPDWQLSGVIPQLRPSAKGLPFEVPVGTYCLDYPYVVANPRKVAGPQWLSGVKEMLPRGSKLLLSFFGGEEHRRAVINGLWVLDEFFEQPWLADCDALVLPDFGGYNTDPFVQMLVAERMQQIWGEDAAGRGHTLIPSIVWGHESSFRRQVELWVSQPSINTVLLDCLGDVNRRLWRWRWLFAIEQHCARHEHVHWLISGMTAGWAIRELNRIFPNRNYSLITPASTFIAAQRQTTDPAYMAARFRRSLAVLEDFRAGREVAAAQQRPEHAPTFADAATAAR